MSQQRSATATRVPRRLRHDITTGRVTSNLVAWVGAIIMLVPLWWAVRTAVMPLNSAFDIPLKWLPDQWVWSNFSDAWQYVGLGRYYLNSIVVTTLATTGAVLSASLTAYGFAFLRAPGRDKLFLLVITGLMIPSVVTMVPLYVMFREIGWLDTWLPLIVPHWFSGAASWGAFSIFLLRQFYRTIPRELRDAAIIDGAGELRIFFQVMMPLALPGHAAAAIFCFLWNWNDLFSPLIYLNDNALFTLPIALAAFPNPMGVTQWHWMMAATLLAMLPCLLLFFFAQRYFIRGIVLSGLKG